jgi:hypothetical protein
MGIGAPIIALFHQLARDGELKDVKRIIELGSQDMTCPGYGQLINRTIAVMGGEQLPDPERIANGGAARDFYRRLGWQYRCIDTDGRHDAVTMDLNFDPAPNSEKATYDLVTNFGTTEHLINQVNAFTVLHDLARPGGLIIHILPCIAVEHGFFTYQPNFFYALARANSYDTLGIWLNPNTALASLIPWQHGMLRYLKLDPNNDAVLVVAQRKMFGVDFKVPFQQVYEATRTEEVAARYQYVVDGEVLNGARVAHLTGNGFTKRS